MGELIFGLFWSSFTAIFTFVFYFSAETITVNGEVVSQEVFSEMLGPKIFLGIFWAVGIGMTVVGLKKIIRNYNTDKFGEVCYGRIINIFASGVYVNEIPELKATVAVYIESTRTLENIDEVIGLETDVLYNVGDYIEGKYYNGDINITSHIPETAIPSHLQDMFKDLVAKEDTITIDGVEYIRKDSMDLK